MAPPRLLDQVRTVLRLRHLSRRTEKAYVQWIRRFIRYHGTRHPREMGAPEITAFLSYLAEERNVAASTQNQALNALVFLYKQVLHMDMGSVGAVVRARRPRRLPVVLSRAEVQAVLRHLQGTHRLAAGLLYGAGLRLLEGLRLRVKDLDLAYHQIVVRDGKGAKDRVTVLPDALDASISSVGERRATRHETRRA